MAIIPGSAGPKWLFRLLVSVALPVCPGLAPAQTSGLDSRPPNRYCVAPVRNTGSATAGIEPVFTSAPAFAQPTKLLQAPGDTGRWFVLEKTGQVKTFTTSNPAAATTWLNFSGRVNTASEGGLLGMAFHPAYPTTREVFVSYTTGTPMVSRISRIHLDSTTAPVNITEQALLTVNQPFSNHNGGEIAFGPDGYLYIGLGDGGSAGDPDNHAQNTTRLLGSILRINVQGVAWPSPGYTIPGNNPFAGNPKCGPGANAASCPEIYAWGLRNPWRFSFDTATGQLWAGDVGQGSYEEVDIIQRGGNYGWRCREGAHPFNTAGCPAGGFVEPVAEYPRSMGVSITGGFVYRGTRIPALVGRYVFGDFGSGRIMALRSNGSGGYAIDTLASPALQISSFGLGHDKEIYLADYSSGRLYRLTAASGGAVDPVPDDLSQTGCVNPLNMAAPPTGVIPFTANVPFWSDGAAKERQLAVPDGTRIDIDTSGDMQFPAGTVLVKTFRLDGRLVETRLLMRHPDGGWAGYTYEWDDAQWTARRVRGGKTKAVGSVTWIFPSEAQCIQCHTAAAGFALGPTIAQLNGPQRYPATGRTANQLTTLSHIGLFSGPLPGPVSSLPRQPDPFGTEAALGQRALSYLAANCSNCHRPGGPAPSDLNFSYGVALAGTNACDAPPGSGTLGIPDARIVAPGDPDRSVLPLRMNRRDVHGMPPVGTSRVDAAGVGIIQSWIGTLSGCETGSCH